MFSPNRILTLTQQTLVQFLQIAQRRQLMRLCLWDPAAIRPYADALKTQESTTRGGMDERMRQAGSPTQSSVMGVETTPPVLSTVPLLTKPHRS